MKYKTIPEKLFDTGHEQLPAAFVSAVRRWLALAILLLVASAHVKSAAWRTLMERVVSEQLAPFAMLCVVSLHSIFAGLHLLMGRKHDKYPGYWTDLLGVRLAQVAFNYNAAIAAFMLAGALYLMVIAEFAAGARLTFAMIANFYLCGLIWFAARVNFADADIRKKAPRKLEVGWGVTLVGGGIWLFRIALVEAMKTQG